MLTKENKRLGMEARANNGMSMKIVGYNNSNDVTIEFEDGTVVTGKKFSEFMKGSIGHPNVKPNSFKKNREGEVNTANNGMKMTITAYHNANNITVVFEDGTIVKNKTYAHFKKGNIKK